MESSYAAISETHDSRELLDGVVREVSAFFGADSALVLLSDGSRLAPAAWVGLQPQLVQENGVPEPTRLQEYMDRFMAPARCSHFMSAPLTTGGSTIGEMVVCSSREGRSPFKKDDRELLAVFARRTAESLENMRATAKAEREKGALASIAAALASETESRNVAQTAVDLAVKALNADAAVVWVARPDERVLELLAITGATSETARALERVDFDAPTLAALAATTREIQSVRGLDKPPGLELTWSLFADGGMQSAIDLPLVARGRLMGVLSFARKTPSDWLPGERGLLSTMADLLASSILNSQLYQESERRRGEQEGLASRLTSANSELVQANVRSAELADLLAHQAVELEAIIANIADAVFVCDPSGKIIMINDAGLETLGVKRKGKGLRTLRDYLTAASIRQMDGKVIPAEELAISRALQGEVTRGVEEIIRDARTGRDRYLIVSAAPVRDPSGGMLGAVEVQSDISRVKELDLLKDQFITVAAHEIKTPVTAIKGFAQSMLRSSTPLDQKYRAALETIVQQSDRIDSLVRDFMEISRMRRGDAVAPRERIDLAALVGRVVERTTPPTAKHRVFVSRSDRALVEGERDRLEEVVMNLLENATRYSPHGGEVEVRIARKKGRAVVSVRDQGVGIPEARRSNVFERFYRAHIGTPLDYGGLGLGLYMSRQIVRQYGGDMWFDSSEGAGSTFYFSLPLIEESQTAGTGSTG